MELRTQLNERLKEALKSGDKVAMATIRLMMAAIKDRDLSVKAQGRAEGLDESEILSIFQSMIKQRQESARTYHAAERKDLAEREEKEIAIIQTFLPAQLSAEEMEDVVSQTIRDQHAEGMKDMGKVMGVLKNNYAGQMDMGKAGGLVKQKLGA